MSNVVKPESIAKNAHIPIFDVEYDMKFADNYVKEGYEQMVAKLNSVL